jgi:hypothetical protein
VTLQFGKYRGCDIRAVPLEYLDWLLQSSRESIHQIGAEIRRRQGLPEELDSSMAMRVIRAGYRELSKSMHPDAGGSHEAMVILNATYEALIQGIE